MKAKGISMDLKGVAIDVKGITTEANGVATDAKGIVTDAKGVEARSNVIEATATGIAMNRPAAPAPARKKLPCAKPSPEPERSKLVVIPAEQGGS
jgi:hypothetical protein